MSKNVDQTTDCINQYLSDINAAGRRMSSSLQKSIEKMQSDKSDGVMPDFADMTVDEFLVMFGCSQADLIRGLGTYQQKLFNWKKSPRDLVIRVYHASGEMKAVLKETIEASGKLTDIRGPE